MDHQRSSLQNTGNAFAEFQILGTIFDIAILPGKIRVGLRSNYLRRNRAGEIIEAPAENHVAIVHHATRRYVQKYAAPGQLVIARGRLSGELIADQFILLGANGPSEG